MSETPDNSPNPNYDVVILGGGLAGLTLGRQLLTDHPGLRIAIVEKRKFPVQEAAHKVGESTVEIGAHYFGEVLKLKKHLTDDQLPKFGLRFFFKDAFQSIDEGTEVGGSSFFAAPSYQVDRGRLENYLAENDEKMGARIYSGFKVKSLELGENGAGGDAESHTIHLSNREESLTLKSRWVVDSTGRASLIKRMYDLEEDLGHDINAVWFRVDQQIQIDQWSDDRDWQQLTGKLPRRWLSTNHLMGEGYWVWLIPLASGSTSIGIVADPRIHPLQELNSIDKSMRWLETHEPECADALRDHLDGIQDFLAIRKMSRGSRQVYSKNRWALVGEAAAFLDPFYSPGSDFIAIGNTMAGKLIEEDLAGRSIEHLAPALQSIFLTLFQNNLLTYRDQYPLFGNPRIMAVKFIWDYAVYWGFPALLYFNRKLTDIGFIQSLSRGVEEIRQLNKEMQDFFREWFKADPEVNATPVFVDQSKIDVMTRLNAELTHPLEGEELKQQFFRNVELIRDLKDEIQERVKSSQPALEDTFAKPNPLPESKQLDEVFEMLKI
ncbi:MAG: tryptophan 7-halogenase [Planctomycetota bacterium]|nr:tryptophan 7-halogenase [Planctomycetota bacterium]